MKKFCFVVMVCLFFSQCLTFCSKKHIQNVEDKEKLNQNVEKHMNLVMIENDTAELIDDPFYQDIDESIKKLMYINELQSPEGGPNLIMMRTNNNDIVYINPINYLDIKNMTIGTVEIPTKFPEDVIETLDEYLRDAIKNDYNPQFFATRPPYSNNKIHIQVTGTLEIFLYDITNKFLDVKSQKNEYEFAHPDAYVNFEISTPEYWAGSAQRSWRTWLMQKDGTFHKNPLEYIISEFSGTVFDNDYIMEIVRKINNTQENIIAKDDVCFKERRDEIFYYFINRMDTYFDINIQDIFKFGEIDYRKTPRREIGIYRDGFFIHNGRKVLLLDIKNHKTTLYAFDEYFNYCNNQDLRSLDCKLFITNDAKTLLVRIEYTQGVDCYNIIYKYEL